MLLVQASSVALQVVPACLPDTFRNENLVFEIKADTDHIRLVNNGQKLVATLAEVLLKLLHERHVAEPMAGLGRGVAIKNRGWAWKLGGTNFSAKVWFC